MLRNLEKKLIIFDFDGTLIDSVPDLAASVNFMMQELGMQPYDVDTIRGWVGNGASTLVKRTLVGDVDIAGVDIGNNIFEKALDIFLDHYEHNLAVETYLYDGVQETLQVLHDKGYKMAIVTNKPYEFIAPILDALQIAHYFSLNIGANSLKNKKPDPEPLLHVIESLHVTKGDALMVGDSKNDILAAKNAGVTSVAVTYGYNYGEDIEIYDPDVIIDRFEDLQKVLVFNE